MREWLGRVGARTLYIEPGFTMGERLHRELQRQAEGRVAEQGGLLHAQGADGAVQADVQPCQAPQRPRLQAARARSSRAC